MTELERDYQKAVRVIASCQNTEQEKGAKRFILNFNNKHNHREYSVSTMIKHNNMFRSLIGLLNSNIPEPKPWIRYHV